MSRALSEVTAERWEVVMKRHLELLSITLSWTALSATTAEATSFVRVADEFLLEQAEIVVEGTVLSIDRQAGLDRPATHYRVEVERAIAGDGPPPGSRLTVRVAEGTLGDGVEVRLFGAPQFEPGQRALLFLKERDDGTWSVLHLLQGAFHLVEVGGREIAFRNFAGALEVESGGAGARHREAPRDLAAFRRWLADSRGGAVRPRDYFVELSEEELADAGATGGGEKFNLIRFSGVPARWREFDDGQPIRWRSHTAGQPGIPDGGVGAIQAALAVWTADAGSNIDYRYSGTSTSTAGTDFRDGLNVVLFDDPNGDFDEPFSCSTGGTVASTFVAARTLEHFHDGQVYYTLIEADVITNSNLECWLPVGVRAREIFAHEFGHGLGLGHSCGDDTSGPCDTAVKDDALMRAQAHDDGRGASLRQDDRAGAAFVYGQAGPSTPAAPGNLAAAVLAVNRVRLTWNDASGDETQFEIQRRTGGGAFAALATVAANVTTYDDTSVVSSTTYTYRVRARNGAGASGFSNEAGATTSGEPPPTGLAATATSDSAIELTWTDNSAAETGFEIEGVPLAGGAPFALLITVPADSETVTLGGLESGTAYRFRVRAIGGSGASSYSNVALATTDCLATGDTLCLERGRFAVQVDWRNFEDAVGKASVVPVTADDSGLLWFFDEDNWEMLVKVLDGCGFNGHFWVFAAATTNVEYTLTVTDTLTSSLRTFVNDLGVSSPAVTEIEAFATCDAGPTVTAPPAAVRAPAIRTPGISAAADKGSCVPDAHTLCLNGGRFQVEVGWRNFLDVTGVASKVDVTADDSGLLWFFDSDNWEMLIKVLDGCGFNGHYWVFSAATTNVEYTLTVTDTETGDVMEYTNPLGTAASATTDVEAFATCPPLPLTPSPALPHGPEGPCYEGEAR
jgi:hypothetical protein